MTETKTIRLYDEQVMLRSCKTVVTACVELKKGFGVELSQTVFYPEGGGQLSDTGKLILADKTVSVTHVREKDGHIYHETAESIAVGTERPYYLAKEGLKPKGVFVRRGSACIPLNEAGIREMITAI